MKNLITYLKALWSSGANSQSSDVGYDCRLTRGVLCFLGKLARRIYSFGCSQDILGAPQSLHGSPSGMTAKLQVNSFMRFAVFLTLIFSLGVGNVWGEEIYRNNGAKGTTNGVNADGNVNDNDGNPAPSFANTSSSDRTFITITGLDVSGYTDVQLTFDYLLAQGRRFNSSFTVSQYNRSGEPIGSATNVTTVTNKKGFSKTTINIASNCAKIVFYGSPTWSLGTYGNYVDNISITGTAVASCTANPTIGTAQLKEPFSLSSVGVTVTGSNVGSPNCSWTDYGFVWGTSANPSLNNSTGNANSGCTKVQKGTSETATTWDGTLTGSFTVGTTYHYRAYGKNGKAGATYYYSSDSTFTPRSVTLMDYTTYATVYTASGTPAVKPEDPTKKGYTFAGWYKEEGLINAVNWSDNITENKTYYAKWTGNPYTITLDNQDATTAGTTSIPVTYGANTNLSSTPAITVPTKTGYTFGGYYTETNGGGTQIIDATGSVKAKADDGKDYWTGESKERLHIGDATLYAKWTINNYTVSWSVNGADWTHGNPSTSVTYNTKPSTIPTAPDGDEVCGGKVFVGWTNAAINSPTDERPAILFTSQSEAPEITENTTFYAVFATASGGGGFDGTNGGTFKIYADVSGIKHYATSTLSSGKFGSTTDASSAAEFTIEPVTGGFTIKLGSDFVCYNSSTNLGIQATSYTWTFADGTKGTWRANSGSIGRGFIYRAETGFGGYSTSNVTAGGSEYFDLEIGGGGTTYSAYSTSCEACTYKLTLTQAATTNGSFTMHNGSAGGTTISSGSSIDNCSSDAVIVVVAEPISGYRVESVSATGKKGDIVDNGDNTYTITYAADANVSSTINVSFEAILTYTVSWSVNGSTWSSGVTDANNNADYNTTVSAPTAPTSSDCDGSKVFVGWTNAEYSDPSSAPTTLFTGTSPAITANTTFYAVFATNGGAGEVLNEEFDNNSTTDSNTAITSSTFANFSGSTSNCYKGAQGDLKMSSSGNNGTITSKSLDLSVSFNITMDVAQYGSDNGSVTITIYDAGDLSTPLESQTISTYGTGKSLDFAAATSTSVIKIAAKNRIYIDNVIVSTSSHSDYATTCCQQPVTQLAIAADQTELVKSGTVNFTLTGGNGKDITWSCRDESDVNCDVLLTSTSNSGATLTIFSPVAATKTYTVKAVQPENDDDAEVVCGKTVTMDITVKAQWTITFKTTDDGSLSTYSTETVTDGDTYTFPDLSDDYICAENYSFAGWKAANSDGAPEYAAGSSAKASADKTWYAVWMYSTGTTTITRDKYELVTSSSAAIAENDVVVIACNSQGVALAQMSTSDTYGSPVAVDFATDKSYLTFASDATVMPLKLYYCSTGDDYPYNGWAFEDNGNENSFLSYGYEKKNGDWEHNGTLVYYDGSLWMFNISIDASGTATITDPDPDYSTYKLQYRTETSRFAFYAGSNKAVQLYRKNGTVSVEVPATPTYSVDNTHCTNGATIRANGGQWITSAKDQKVRITVPVTAKNFATSSKQLTASSDNSHFSVSFPSHTIPSDKSEVEVQMTVEYTPEDANVIEEANITITTGTGDGNATKVIYVNGRSLPDEFVIVTQKEGKWQALPANMFSGTGTYSPMEVTPNGGITAIPAAPYTTIYSAREVASGRYESAGTCMRLVGNNNKCLWANNSSNGTGIQNFAALGNTNGAQYEWLLSTADGEQYTIANPAHPDYETGRQLGIYTLKYGLYKTTDIFYLLPVGCSSQPGNLQITPRRVDAMFSWETNAASVTIDLWTNEAMSTGHKQAVVTSVPYQFTGLTENTDYWYKITPGSDDDCAVTGTFSTTGPTIDVVEWGENSATIFVDKDEAVDPQIIIAGEVEYGQGSGAAATDIFFSKYFEAEGTAKMLAIYNGTGNAISLADITILHRSTTKNYTPLSLASYGKTAGWIQPGEEIILFNRDNRAAVMSCAESDPTYPSWNNVENTNLAFSGKGTIRLFRGNECIDIIGAMEAGKDINDKAVNPIEGSASPSFGDANGFVSTSGDNYATKETVENDYELSTNRCLLIRQNWVTSGDSAVLNNFDDFKTLGTYTGVDSKTHKGEWAGLQVPDAVAPDADYIHTCEGFQEVGKFDYNQYYREYTQIGEDKYLSEFTRAEDGTYTLSIGNMRKYACLNLKFQLTEHDNKANVLTEQTVQVPIVVKDARNSNDTLFNNIIKTDKAPHTPMVPQSIERCKTCNVVVLGTGTLTKAADGTTNDVAEVRDVKVYPGGKLIVPEGTHYVINSLSLRRQEDEIASAKIDAGLSSDPSDGNKKGLYIRESNGVYLDVRIDPSNWHYFTLPYDCRVGDIRFSDGTPAKVNNDYLLSWYDGAYRAEHKDGGWTDITEEDYVLKKGLGYIVALPGEGLIKRELRFPMANEVISAELANKEVGGLYAYGGDKTDEELRPNHKGWNMIGNPYLYDYTTDIVKSPLATGELTHDPSSPWNGQWVRTGSARYIVEPIDNGWTGYRQTTISNLKPFTSYFIQIGTTTDGKDNPETERNITFTKTSKASIARRNMPAAEAEEPMYPVWYGIEMTAPNAEKDNTTLLISDEFTDGYDMMDDLIKMRGSYYQYYPYPVLASRNNEGEMAFNALPDSSASVIGVPLNYYAAQAGTYTIRTDSRFDLEEVKSAMLYDATTNQYNDLLAGDYSFTTAKGDNTNRFKLFVRVERKKAPDVATGTDNILENGKLSLIAIDRTLVLSGLDEAADIYVYDMSGKLMNSDHASGSGGIWRANVSAQGVYFVRVNSQSGQQTLRTIVK